MQDTLPPLENELGSQVLTTLAELQATLSSAALVTLRMQLACTPQLKTKGSDNSKVLLLKLSDAPDLHSLAPSTIGDAAQHPVVTVCWIHNAERCDKPPLSSKSLHSEVPVNICCPREAAIS